MAAIQNFKLEDGSTLIVQGDFSYEIIAPQELTMDEVVEDPNPVPSFGAYEPQEFIDV